MLPSQRYDLGKTIGSTSDAVRKLVDSDLIFIDDASEYNDAQKVRIAQAGDLIKDCLPVGLAGEQIIDLASNGIYYQLKFVNGFLVKVLEGIAGINLGPQLGYFYTNYGEESEAQYYVVYAFGLTDDLIITAPLYWEISLERDGIYEDSLNIAPINGIVDKTQIWVRIKDTAPQGELNDNIIHMSNGVDTVLMPVNGKVL